METIEHEDRLVDVHAPAGAATTPALLWHGRGPRERGALAALGAALARDGVLAVVPDWDAAADDGGRAALLTSVRLARDLAAEQGLDPDALAVVGWSLGGVAALSLGLNARRLGVAVPTVVALASAAVRDDPLSGAPLQVGRRGGGRTTFELVHAGADPLVPRAEVDDLATRLLAGGWSVGVASLPGADHHSVVADVRAHRLVSAALLGA